MAKAHVISVVNMKGGVGKTTISVALAEALAVMAKKKVLVIDLDAQASCTFALVGETGFTDIQIGHRHTQRLFKAFLATLDERDGEMADDELELPGRQFQIFRKKAPRAADEQAVKARTLVTKEASFVEGATRLSLIGAIPELQLVERDILYRLGRLTQTQEKAEGLLATYLKDKIDELSPLYDAIIIDCPPGISALTEAAVRATRTVLAPVTPDFLSYMGLQAFSMRVVRKLKREGLFTGRAFAILNRVQAIASHDDWRAQIADLADSMGDDLRIFPKQIEQSPDLAKAVAAPPDGRKISIRQKYASSIPTLEDLASNVLDVTEKAHA
jgi:chromosome partitioning protein